MKQKPWDRYEAALLLSYCLKIEAGDIPRKEAVDIVSNTLRKRAEVQGVEIDETFRNTNGISMQMSAIRNCYLGKDHGLAGSKLLLMQALFSAETSGRKSWMLTDIAICLRSFRWFSMSQL